MKYNCKTGCGWSIVAENGESFSTIELLQTIIHQNEHLTMNTFNIAKNTDKREQPQSQFNTFGRKK